MANRVVTKALAGLEDLLLGYQAANQARASGTIPITGVSARGIPYDLAAGDTIRQKLGKKVEVLTNVAAMQALDTNTEAELYVYLLGYTSANDGGGGFFWLDTSDTTSTEDLSVVFNPNVLANGRWKRIDTTGQISADVGDANLTLTSTDQFAHLFATALTANRTVILPVSGLYKGLTYRIVRLDTALFTLDVGGVKVIPSGESAACEVMYDGTAWRLVDYAVFVSGVTTATPSAETNITFALKPNYTLGLVDTFEQGAEPAWFNQTWGGPNWAGVNQDPTKEVHTAQLLGGEYSQIGNVATNVATSQGFKVAKDCTLDSVILKLSKQNNPTDNVTVEIWDDSAGLPNALITNGTATVVPGKTIEGSVATTISHKQQATFLVQFNFPTPPSLTANTQYHIVTSRSGALDATNYYTQQSYTGSSAPVLKPYPDNKAGLQDTGPVWTMFNNAVVRFFILLTSIETLQNGGLFSVGKLTPFEGSPLNQSAFWRAKRNSLTSSGGTYHIAGAAFTKDKTIADIGIGLDANRVAIRSQAATGFAQVTLYEDDTTTHTITGTTDISSGNHTVNVIYRSLNDGSDFIYLYVDGQEEGTSITSASLLLSPLFNKKATHHFGGGAPLAPTWTQALDMATLPSANGWTWTSPSSAVVENTAMTIHDSKLYQDYGFLNGAEGYYARTTALNNATGWCIEAELEITRTEKTNGATVPLFHIDDGTYRTNVCISTEDVCAEATTSFTFFKASGDFFGRNVWRIEGKGSDIYIFCNNKLVFDGTGAFDATATSGSNRIWFGKVETIGATGAVQWHSFKYFEGQIVTQATSGEISEVATWSDDKRSILSSIYNSGSIQSVKDISKYQARTERSKLANNGAGHDNSLRPLSSTYVSIERMFIYSLGLRSYTAKIRADVEGSSAGSQQFDLTLDTTVGVGVGIVDSAQAIVEVTAFKSAVPILGMNTCNFMMLNTTSAFTLRHMYIEAEAE